MAQTEDKRSATVNCGIRDAPLTEASVTKIFGPKSAARGANPSKALGKAGRREPRRRTAVGFRVNSRMPALR